VEYIKGFEFEINEIEYQVNVVDGSRATCIRTITHDGTPESFEMPVKQLEKLDTKPREVNEEMESEMRKSHVEEVKKTIESGEKSVLGSKKIEKKRVSYVAEQVQVKTKVSEFEEKAKEIIAPTKEEPMSPKRPKPIGNLAARMDGLNIDPTKLRQGAYAAAKLKKKRRGKSKVTSFIRISRQRSIFDVIRA